MKYNSKYDRWVTKGGLVYRYSKRQDKLVLCKLSVNTYGYLVVAVKKPKRAMIKVHRLVFETFNWEIPLGYQIDHINTTKTDNRLENLRCVTPKENTNNPLTIKHISESKKGNTCSEFGSKFFEYYGKTRIDDVNLYNIEYGYYYRHNNTCRWEINENADK